MTILLILLLLFMIIAAVIALYTEELLSAVIAVGAVGFGCSAVFLLLGAPDLAITQVVVEVIALVLLIRATLGVSAQTARGRAGLPGQAAAFLLTGLIFLFAVFSWPGLPRFGVPVMERVPSAPSIFYLEEGLALTGAANRVMAILLDFRAYDTLGEATIIFTAVFGALTLLRPRGKRREPVKTDEKP